MSAPQSSNGGEAPLYAVAAEFNSPDAVLAAARALQPEGFGRLEIYSPVPVPGALEAIGRTHRSIPVFMAVGAVVLGGAFMMGMCIYATAVSYVFDIGGRPLVSWPAFVVPTVSFAMLSAALVVFFNWTFLCRLPMLNHPSFNVPGFLRASQDRFFLTVTPPKADDPSSLDAAAVERALSALAARPLAVSRVAR